MRQNNAKPHEKERQSKSKKERRRNSCLNPVQDADADANARKEQAKTKQTSRAKQKQMGSLVMNGVVHAVTDCDGNCDKGGTGQISEQGPA